MQSQTSCKLSPAVDIIGPLLTDTRRIRREAIKRRKIINEKTFGPEEVEAAISDGWKVQKSGRKKSPN